MSTHEDFSRTDDVAGGSDRAFGLVFAVVFAVIALYPLLAGNPPRLWSLVIAAAFAAVALLRAGLLAPLNRLWTRFGLLLHRIVSPLVLGFMYFAVLTPTGLLLRLFGKDLLALKHDPAAQSYWILRTPPGPAPDSLKQQF